MADVSDRTGRLGMGDGRRFIEGGSIRLEVPARQAWVGARPVRLTKIEFELLAYFLAHPRVVLDRTLLLEMVWGYTSGGVDTVTVHVHRLRSKIEADPADPQLIKTVWGSGYFLDIPDAGVSPQDGPE